MELYSDEDDDDDLEYFINSEDIDESIEFQRII